MLGANYKTKKLLKESVGKPLKYVETSLFGPEYHHNGKLTVVGPCPYKHRNWYAIVEMKDGLIVRVS